MKFAVFVAALLLILVGGLALRLAYGPVSLDPFRSYFVNAVSDAFGGADVAFDSAHLTWDGGAGALDIRLENVDISTVKAAGALGGDATKTGFAAHFGSVGLGLSRASLLLLRIEPKHLVLYQPELTVEWSAETLEHWASERLRFSSMGPPMPRPKDETPPLARAGPLVDVIQTLLASPKSGHRLGQLERVEITSADIRVIERRSKVEWRLPEAHLEFVRGSAGISFSADLALEAGGRRSRLNIETGPSHEGAREVEVGLDGLNPAELARDVGLEGIFESIDVPVYGSLSAEIAPDGQVERVDFDMGAGGGAIWVPALYQEQREIDSAALLAHYEVARKILYVESLSITHGASEVRADGIVEFVGEIKRPIIKAHATLTDMSVGEVAKYWPPRLSPNSRRWILKNILEGRIIEARFDIAIEPHMWGMRPLPGPAFRIAFDVADVSVNYLAPMPVVVHANATGSFTADALNIDVATAEIDGIPVRDSNVFIDKAGYRGLQKATVTAQMEGSVPDFMRLIEYEPLQLVSKYNIPAADLSGHAFAVAEIRFPPRAGITIDDVEVKVEADVTDGAMPSLMDGGGLSNAAIRMNIDKRGLSANGRVSLKDSSFHLYWTESFLPAPDDVMTSHYELTGNLDAVQLASFGVPAVGSLTGEVHSHIYIEGRAGTPVRGTGEVDLFGAEVNEETLAWTKPGNAPGTATFELGWTEEDLKVSSLMINSPGIEAEGNFVFDRLKGDMKEARVPKLVTEGHDLSLISTLQEGGVYDVVIDAKRIDARIYLADMLLGEDEEDMPPMLLSVRSKEAIALNGVKMLDVTLEAENTGDFWASAEINSSMADGGSLSVIMGPAQSGGRRVATLTSDDAGKAARGAGLFVNGTGGTLNGTAELHAQGDPDRLSGLIQIADFRVVNSSALVDALVTRFGQDVDSYVDEQGIDFERFRLPFVIADGVIDITDARANGPSIGFTLQGQVNRAAGQVNVSGAIVPAYALNSLIGNIPVLGGLLTGGEGGGLFALTYRIVGSVEEPEVSFNPLSALAPGLLRKIFEGPKGTVDPTVPDDSDKGEDGDNSDAGEGPDGASGNRGAAGNQRGKH